MHVTSGDLVVFCDADIREFDPGFVLGLLGPLLTRDDVTFVKGYYERPLDGRPGEGGRVTELMARPLISVFFPHLAGLHQPLAGECAARRDVLEAVPFVGGYGVDLGLLIDVTERFGTAGLVQCDLGERVHRNRPLAELGVQALAILQLAPGAGRAVRGSNAGRPSAGPPTWCGRAPRPSRSPWSSGRRWPRSRPTARRPDRVDRAARRVSRSRQHLGHQLGEGAERVGPGPLLAERAHQRPVRHGVFADGVAGEDHDRHAQLARPGPPPRRPPCRGRTPRRAAPRR